MFKHTYIYINISTTDSPTSSTTKDNQGIGSLGPIGVNEYEIISDEELDLFDEGEEDVKLPQPTSVLDVDWSLLTNMKKTSTQQNCKF